MPQDTNDHVRLVQPKNAREARLQQEFVQLTQLVTSTKANRQQRRKHHRMYEQLKAAGLVIVERSVPVEEASG